MAKFGMGEADGGNGTLTDRKPAKLGDLLKAKTWSQLRFLYHFVLPYKWFLLFAGIFGIMKTLTNLAFPYVSKLVTDDLSFAVGHHFGTATTHTLLGLCGWMLVIYVINAVVQFYRTSLPIWTSSLVAADLRVALYRHIQKLSADFYEGRRTGSIVSRLISDIEQVRLLCGEVPVAMIFDLFAFIPTSIVIWMICPAIAMMALIPGFLYALIHWWIGPKVRNNSRRTQEVLAQLAGTVTENVTAMRLIQSYSSEDHQTRMVSEQVSEHQGLHALQAKYQGLFGGGAEFMPALGRLGVLLATSYLILHPEINAVALSAAGSHFAWMFSAKAITMGDLLMVLLLLNQLYFPLQRSSQTMNQVCVGLGALDTINEYMTTAPTVKEGPGVPNFARAQGAVQFDHVSFAYPLAPTETVLKDVCADIKPGTHIALVGPSGGGKSTIAALLCRFYDPGLGAIRLDGHDLREFTLHQLRDQIGLVMQDSILFSGTVRDNMQLGKPGASDPEIITALKNAGAWSFINEMPDKLDGLIGERGSSLSGGQKQRLSIARAFLKNPALLILDEATAALDAESEALIQEALDRLIVGKTAVIIAHRLSTVMSADLLLVIDHGVVVERGTHMELLAQDGLYTKLVRTQFGQAAKVIEASGVLRNRPREETAVLSNATLAALTQATEDAAERLLTSDARPLDSTRFPNALPLVQTTPLHAEHRAPEHRTAPARTQSPAPTAAETAATALEAAAAPEGIAAPASGITEAPTGAEPSATVTPLPAVPVAPPTTATGGGADADRRVPLPEELRAYASHTKSKRS
ncbi:MAG: ABC transporter ATP-binding protein [Planctomycetota bacterium]